ncbi:hypothetical protein GCM10010909_14310 [Acidocella aquatica]|uniref:DUF2029 domain-containing protein n=1 Tax=Acidocella aquatica TaxID=1922313 RepID=A0ABQ6A7C0_9PROT|nr:glycosyltransferase family 87 protein [Acidocella aquatica]GLR66751.1 hypothetical protein GCM10010909_14310 [Acidocella aquatica]
MPPEESGWDINGRALRWCLLAVLAGCAAVGLNDLAWIGWLGPDLHEDFFGIWSFARFSVLHPGAGIYDFARLQAFQQEAAPDFAGFYPCPYPPSFLAMIAWLGHLPIGLAKSLWTVAGLALLTGAGWVMFRPPLRGFALLAIALAPASLLNATIGETAFFGTALLMAGFAWLPARPVLAGIAFGLLTLKPQLGVLVPIALLARGDWRAIVTAGLTALGLAGASLLVFPFSLWRAWLRVLPRYQQVMEGNTAQLSHFMATLNAAALDLHAGAGVALAAQLIGGIAIALVVWVCFRRADYRLAVAALLAGTALAAPHDYVYDTVFLPVALLLAGEWMAARGMRISTPLLALFLAVYVFPLAISRNADICLIYIVLEALMFLSIARLALKGAPLLADNFRTWRMT